MKVQIGNQTPGNQTTSNQSVEENTAGAIKNYYMAGITSGMDFQYLSPESLLEYVQQQLQQLDTDIGKQMADVNTKIAAAKALGQVGAFLKETADLLGTEDKKGWKDLKKGALGEGHYEYVVGVGLQQGEKKSTMPHTPTGPGKAAAKAEIPAGAKNVTWVDTKAPDSILKAKWEASLANLEKAAQAAEAAGNMTLAKDLNQLANQMKKGEELDKGKLEALGKYVESELQSYSNSQEMTMIKLQELMQRRSRTLMFVSNALKALDEPADQAVRNIA